jgi:hypothetical protein
MHPEERRGEEKGIERDRPKSGSARIRDRLGYDDMLTS